jgi:hypothetical protein
LTDANLRFFTGNRRSLNAVNNNQNVGAMIG